MRVTLDRTVTATNELVDAEGGNQYRWAAPPEWRSIQSSFTGTLQSRFNRRSRARTKTHVIIHDLRDVTRGLARAKTLTAVLLASLALGTGLNAAVYGLADALLFGGSVGVTNPSSVVQVYTTQLNGMPYGRFSYPDYLSLTRAPTPLSSIAATRDSFASIRVGLSGQRVRVASVTPTFFPTLGLSAHVGRLLDATDTASPTESLSGAAISFRLWDLLGRDDRIVWKDPPRQRARLLDHRRRTAGLSGATYRKRLRRLGRATRIERPRRSQPLGHRPLRSRRTAGFIAIGPRRARALAGRAVSSDQSWHAGVARRSARIHGRDVFPHRARWEGARVCRGNRRSRVDGVAPGERVHQHRQSASVPGGRSPTRDVGEVGPWCEAQSTRPSGCGRRPGDFAGRWSLGPAFRVLDRRRRAGALCPRAR